VGKESPRDGSEGTASLLGFGRGESRLRNWRWALLRHWSMASLFQGRVDTVALPRKRCFSVFLAGT